MRKPRGRYTREKAKLRYARRKERQEHISAVQKGEASEELPDPLFPEVFKGIQETYWSALKSVPDPRSPGKRVYPLYLILHRIISGFLAGNKHIGVLFPKKRNNCEPGKKKLGALPTRKPVYQLLRRIDWQEANAILSPLWQQLGFTPELIVERKLRNPRVILDEFKKERELFDEGERKSLAEKREQEERVKGMSAARAKNPKLKNKNRKVQQQIEVPKVQKDPPQVKPVKIIHDLVIDGKVMRASYNSGTKERFVHVTEIKQDKDDNRSRFIISARPTE